MRKFWAVVFFLVACFIGGCGKQKEMREAERMAAHARLLEDQVDSLAQAVAAYRLIAERFPDLPPGGQARERGERLARVEEVYRRTGKSVPGDSAVIVFCKEVLSITPDYRPAIRRLGGLYHSQIDFVAQLAASPLGHNPGLMNQAWSLWKEQDSLWTHYDFRALHEDREWGDRLCRSSQVVANMLSKYDLYPDALATVERGLAYAGTDAETARAKVYAAYYHFWLKHFDRTAKLAREALDTGLLEKPEKAKAYHALGMGYAYIYMDTRKGEDLDGSIKALNESLLIEPDNVSARELLKAMRDARFKLGANP